jgi:hypothetical protein
MTRSGHSEPYTTSFERIVLGWRRSRHCTEQRADARGQAHGHSALERKVYCAYRHNHAVRACGQCTQKREEHH